MEVERPADTAEAKLALVGGLGGAEEGRASDCRSLIWSKSSFEQL